MELVALALVALAAVGLWRWLRGRREPPAEDRLVRICLGDRQQAQHLIEAEQRRTPGIARDEAARRAVFRYERDNR